MSCEPLDLPHLNNPAFQWLACWAQLVLYDPTNQIATLAKHIRHVLFQPPPLISLIILPAVVTYVFYYCVCGLLDAYQGYLDLGRGGTPSTPLGFLKVSIKKFVAGIDVLAPPHVPPMLEPYRGRLFSLPVRRGTRPVVKGVAPQRQFNQKTSPETFDRLLGMLRDTANTKENTCHLMVTTSFLEGHTQALKAIYPQLPAPAYETWNTEAEWDFEIAHPHRNDGSLHMVLHPEDVRTVIDRGWGERHPLATDRVWWRLFYHFIRLKRRPVPVNLVLVYAPRTEQEFGAVRQILDAAVWWNLDRRQHYLRQVDERRNRT